MTRITVAALLTLIALPAAAQSTYQNHCVTERSGSTIVRNCSATYTPPPAPEKPVEHVRRGPGSRQDVYYYRNGSAEPQRQVTPNHCGAGFIYVAGSGCELVR